MKTIIVAITFIASIILFLYLDNLLIQWAVEDVKEYKNVLTIGLWCVLLSVTGAMMIIVSVVIAAITKFILGD
jgi:hypothetical protein